MTLSFDRSDKQGHTKCLGAQLILSCGFVHKVLHIMLQLGQMLHSLLVVPRSWVHLYQWVSVVHSTRVLSAQVVHSSIPVLSVELRTLLKAVIFVPQANPLLQGQQLVCALPTPVKINRLLPLLQGYVVKVVLMLFEGFTYGFPLHFEGSHTSFCSTNLISANQNPGVVSSKLDKEIVAGRIAGPFSHPPFFNFRVSPLGVVHKKVPGEFRLIHHLSFPHGASINDGISSEHTTVSYSRVDNAIAIIKKLGRGCFLAKTDIKSAFRIIPIRPADYPLLGIMWQGKCYYDRAMPMGCASSCRTFEMFSTALEWVAKTRCNISHLIHILDDYLMASSSHEQCRANLRAFLSLCEYLGVSIAPEKTGGPSTILTSAGIQLDTNTMEARLPADKILKTRSFLSEFLCRKKAQLKEVQSLIGLLNFACTVVLPGRAFLRRLIDLTKGVNAPFYRIRLTRSVKADLGL